MDWIAFGTWLAVAYVCAFAFVGAALALRKHRRAAPLSVAAALFFACVGTVVAQKGGGTNEPPRLAARPVRVAAQTPRPSAPAKVAKINARGAWRDSFLLDFGGGFLFPFGTNRLSSVEIFSQGYVRPRRRSSEIVADTGLRAAIVPGVSSISVELTPSNSWRIEWTDAAQNRDTNTLVSASIELMRSGDVAVTTNGVTRTIPRVHPHDLDGDGVLDALDAHPGVCDGDFFGPPDTLPSGANTNAYCWIDLVVHDADAEVVFSGDGYSDLADPHFMARAEVTNRVTILIGKGYEVTCDEAIECVGVSDDSVEVWNHDERSLHVRWPVTIDYIDGDEPQRGGSLLRSRGAALRGNGAPGGLSRRMRVVPDWLGGEFEWATNHCCGVSMSGFSLLWSCGGDCGCGGCEAHGDYVYEGYRIYALGGSCGCAPPPAPDTPPGPTVSVSFSEDALFYEEAYTNAPGDVTGRRVSTNATFVCSVYGGERGGTLTLSTANFGKLQKTGGDELPQSSVELAPRETRTWTAQYAPLAHSDAADDVTATAVFAETLSGDVLSADASLTVVELELTPWVTKEGCDHRHMVGVAETINCTANPDVGQWCETGGGELAIHMGQLYYVCPITADGSKVSYSRGGSTYCFDVDVIEPRAITAEPDYAFKYGVATNCAGGVGMALRLHVLPDAVSFSGIAMEEVPSAEGEHSGYFANLYFMNVWYHSTDRGAGRWGDVGADNSCGDDIAEMGETLPRELPDGSMTFNLGEGTWSSGTIEWEIPWGWSFHSRAVGDVPVKIMQATYNQVFSIDEQGMLSIMKFGNTVSRGTNNVVRINGVIQEESQLHAREVSEGVNAAD